MDDVPGPELVLVLVHRSVLPARSVLVVSSNRQSSTASTKAHGEGIGEVVGATPRLESVGAMPARESSEGETHDTIDTSGLEAIGGLNLQNLAQVDVELGANTRDCQTILTNSSRDTRTISKAK